MTITRIYDHALEAFLDAWGGDTAEAGPHFTCDEVDALAALFRAHGRDASAQSWLDSHAEEDDCGDRHCHCEGCAPKTVAEKLDAAKTGDEFAGVVQGLFSTLEAAMDKEEDQ